MYNRINKIIMKQILLVIFLFVNIFCFGQEIYIDSKQENKIVLDVDSEKVSYMKMYDDMNLYKSSYEQFPYIYRYTSKDTLYFLVKKEEIKIKDKEILINIHNDKHKKTKLSILEYRGNRKLMFYLNSEEVSKKWRYF